MKYLLKYIQDFVKYLTLLKTSCLVYVSDIFSRSYHTKQGIVTANEKVVIR